jgi:hypothetical protein
LKTCWLTIPYIVLAAVAAVRFCLLSVLPGDQEDKWSRQFFRALRDLAFLCLLTLLACSWLSGFFPWVNLVMLSVLATVLLVKTALVSILWLLCAGQAVPHRLSRWAIAVARFQPGQGSRALGWGAAFVFTGAAALIAYLYSGDMPLLLAAFLSLTLGFVSLLQGASRLLKAKKA